MNGAPVRYPRVLPRGDVLLVGPRQLRLPEGDEPRENEACEAAIEAAPGDPAPLVVWADWLQEQKDPLGERISRAASGLELPSEPWTEGLWRAESQGRLDLTWRQGLLVGAVVRPTAAPSPGWERTLSRVLATRAARLLERLTVDVLHLERQWEQLGPTRGEPRELRGWLAQLLAVPLPRTLRSLCLGYTTADHPGDVVLEPAQAALLPRLEDPRVFRRRAKARLVRRSLSSSVVVEDDLQQVPLTEGLRVRVVPAIADQPPMVRFEPADPVGVRTTAELRTQNDRWVLLTGPPRAARVNGRLATEQVLLPGDGIDFGPGAVFELQLE